MQFLQCHHIDQLTSSPHIPRCNGFIECKSRPLTQHSVPVKSHTSHWLTCYWTCDWLPSGSTCPHLGRSSTIGTFQCHSKPSTPVDMECICNYLVSKCHSQKQSFNREHSIRELQELQPGQEVLFLSPAADQYIPGTVIDKATILCSYIIDAQSKRYCRTREHIRPIHLNIPFCKAPHQQQLTLAQPHPQTATPPKLGMPAQKVSLQIPP